MYAKRKTALYCSDVCKKQYNREKRKTQNWYSENPNKGKRLPLGTVTSWDIPEEKLIFTGDLVSLYCELADYMSPEQLIKEKEFIESCKPFSETHEWTESSEQILTDINYMEVLRVFPKVYKFYVWPWGPDNKKPSI